MGFTSHQSRLQAPISTEPSHQPCVLVILQFYYDGSGCRFPLVAPMLQGFVSLYKSTPFSPLFTILKNTSVLFPNSLLKVLFSLLQPEGSAATSWAFPLFELIPFRCLPRRRLQWVLRAHCLFVLCYGSLSSLQIANTFLEGPRTVRSQ